MFTVSIIAFSAPTAVSWRKGQVAPTYGYDHPPPDVESDGMAEEDEEDTATATVVMEIEDANFKEISPVKVSRALRELSIGTFRALPTTEGDLKVTLQQSKVSILKSLESFLDLKVVSVTEQHGTSRGPRTYVWGKIFSRALLNAEDEEILEELQEENDNILDVKRIHKGKDKIKTGLLRIKFNGELLPKSVYCLNMSYDVEQFIPPVKKML